jgi:hypothetical protein
MRASAATIRDTADVLAVVSEAVGPKAQRVMEEIDRRMKELEDEAILEERELRQ